MSRAVSSGALRAVASRLASAPAASASRPAPRFAFGRAETHSRPSFDAPPRDFRGCEALSETMQKWFRSRSEFLAAVGM